MTILRVAVVVVSMLLTPVLQAQRGSESIQVTVIEVPVTAVDRDGNAVRGLTAENFEVYDGGKRVPVEYFEVVDISAVSADAEAPLPPAAARHFLLMFDLTNSSPGTIGRSAEAAAEFVQSQLQPRDSAAVATFTAESGARMITNFTRDRALLINAIETLGNPKWFKVMDPLMITAIRTTGGDSTGATGPGGRGAEGIDAAFAEYASELERVAQSSHDSEMRNRLRIQLNNLGSVARALDGLHGQKQIILLSEGFDARLVQGREDLGSQNTQAEADSVLSGEVWNVDSEKRFGSTSSSRDVSEMANIFRRSDVRLHAIDIKGLRGNTDASSAGAGRGKSAEGLHLITTPTGGSVFKNANDIGENFQKLMKQQEVVYILGFKARSTGKPGSFHEVKVKPVNARGARLVHRTGYYEPAARISDLERTLTLGEILLTDAKMDDVSVTMGATTLPGPGGKARVPVVVEVPGPKLLSGVTGNAANAHLYLYAFNEQGQVADYLQQRISLDLTKAGDVIRASGVRYYGSLRLPPGNHAIKALVRVDESGRIGFRRFDVNVPAFDRAAVMPPVLFSEAGNWAMLAGPGRGDDYAYPFSVGEDRYIPRSQPELTNNGEYKVALFLYRVPLENLGVVPTLVTAGGTTVPAPVSLLGRTSADERGSVKLLFNFKPENLASGTHELRFDVKGNDGSQSVVSLPFVVR